MPQGSFFWLPVPVCGSIMENFESECTLKKMLAGFVIKANEIVKIH